MKLTGYIYRLLHYLPLLGVVAAFAYVIKAANQLGYIPEYNHPDPKELNFHFLHKMNLNLFSVNCILIPVLMITDLIPKLRTLLNVSKRGLGGFITGALVFMYLYFVSFFGEWIFD